MQVWQETLEILRKRREQTDTILVAYSGGKDSLCVLDLCVRQFKRVICFYMYWSPDMFVIQKQVDYAKKRWGVDVVFLPHFVALNCLREGVFCNQGEANDRVPELKLKDIYGIALQQTHTDLMATGAKDADGLPRRQFFANIRDSKEPIWQKVIYPIRKWRKHHILSYLKAHNIPLPPAEAGSVTSGVDLSWGSLMWLWKDHRSDFEKLEKMFPYIRAQVKRTEWYGIQ
jgi:3'-phosphoadenosine 5'-phosphosulfate sulfotransferase (PAPS reductase)/FAD synthetase